MWCRIQEKEQILNSCWVPVGCLCGLVVSNYLTQFILAFCFPVHPYVTGLIPSAIILLYIRFKHTLVTLSVLSEMLSKHSYGDF